MRFNYSRHKLSGQEKILERIFEIMPGAISWGIIIGMIILSLIKPLIAAMIMIAFILYWVLRLLYMNIFLILSYIRLANKRNADWGKNISAIDKIEGSSPKSKEIYHLVIMPVIKEARQIVEPGIAEIAQGGYPAKRVLLIIAVEESASAEIKSQMQQLQQKYEKYFLELLITMHPADAPGEAKVKGANATYAARRAAEYFAKADIPYENVIVSCFDADTVPAQNYLSCLTYYYMITPNRTQASYQPIPVYYNNIWDVPSFARIIDIGSSFFQLVEATNPRRLVTFSSHSMSFKALVDIGYWPVDMISDDSAIFWKALIHYDGKYQTVPIYTTVSMDIAAGRNYTETFINIYKQKRRWAWGVENVPIVIRAFLKSKKISLYKRVSYGFKLLDSFISWATWSFLLTFVSWIPVLFASREFASTTIYYVAPRIQRTTFSLASFGILICMVISLLLLPRKKSGRRLSKRILHALEWFFIPVVILALSALPALDAQTRLMFAKYMEFRVTDKYRKRA